ncbi:MAG TPA: hypothetical protein VMS60_00240 [Solirubrobacterales bacterium]|nr:hypothetical protein [Solirubrobacterales bacterium]
MKFLLVPLAIFAFVLLLIVLGAIGLGIAFTVIYLVGRIWRLLLYGGRAPVRLGRRIRGRR